MKTKLVILVILIALVGGFLWYTKTPLPTDVPIDTASSTPTEVVTVEIPVPPLADTSDIDTSNWLTYTNTKYGYSLKYPANLEPTIGGMWTTQTLADAPDMLFIDTKGTRTLFDDDTVFGVEVRDITELASVRIQKFLDEERSQKRLNTDALSTGETLVRRGISPITEVYKIDDVFPVYQYMISFYFDASDGEQKTNTWGPFTAFDHEQQGFAISFRNENPISVAMLKSMTFR